MKDFSTLRMSNFQSIFRTGFDRIDFAEPATGGR